MIIAVYGQSLHCPRVFGSSGFVVPFIISIVIPTDSRSSNISSDMSVLCSFAVAFKTTLNSTGSEHISEE